MTSCVRLSKEVPVDIVVEISKHVVVEAVVLVNFCQIFFHSVYKVSEEHLVVDEDSVVEVVLDEGL